MTGRPVGRGVRAVVPMALCAALAAGPLWGIGAGGQARAITPAEAAAAGYIPNPAPALASIAIDEVTPEVLDGTSGAGGAAVDTESGVPTVSVSGHITNVGDVPLEAVDVRLQRGPRAASTGAVRDPLVWSEPSFPVGGSFLRVTEALAPGESIPYTVSMPARNVPGTDSPDLQLTEPGVYPLLVNVNGTPAGGSPARLDDARVQLPVLATPPTGSPRPEEPAPARIPLTVLWPLASAPTRVAPVPGVEGTEPVVMLTDDTLPTELSEGGRLTGLVRAADEAFDGPGGPALRESTCLAVDPDLLGTVSEIAGGRQVVIDPDGNVGEAGGDSAGEEVPQVDSAAVADDAARWLDELRALADGACVVTMPAAQADLDAVAQAGSTELTRTALDRAATVERILDVAPVPDILLPASGTLRPGTAEALAGQGATAIVAASSTRTATGLVPPPGLVGPTTGVGTRALTFSPAIGAALAATGAVPENPHYSDPDTRYWLTADSEAARLQNARAAMLAPVIDAIEAISARPGPDAPPPAPGTPGATALDQGLLAVPPQVWTVDGAGAASLLETLGTQLAEGRFRAMSLTDRLSAPVTIPDGRFVTEPTGAIDPGAMYPYGADPHGDTIGPLTTALDGVATLRSLVDTSDPRSADATRFLQPMVDDALRAISETGRRADGDGVDPDTGTGAAAHDRTRTRLERLNATVTAALARVDLLPPGSVFTMASPNSPLLLVVRNGLPFPVRVGVAVNAPPELTVEPPGILPVPASGSRTVQVPTQSDSDGGDRHTVTFALHGPGGRPLSEPVELSVHTGGYPVAQAFALAAAALALVLGGRRYLRYRRGILDPADEGHRP